MSQLSLFDWQDPLHPASKVDLPVEEISLNLDDSTFVGGMERPIHRWYKLRPSFSPALVERLIERLSSGKRRLVLDPFAGAATTCIEAALLGRPTMGVEINPFLVAFGQRALDWSAPAGQVRKVHTHVRHSLEEAARVAERHGLPGVQSEMGIEIPPIHNVFRWWRDDVLAHLLAAKVVMRWSTDPLAQRMIWLALGTVCIEVANIKRLHPTLTFYDRTGEFIDTPGMLLAKLGQVAEDLAHVADLPKPRAEVVEGNSRFLKECLGGRRLLANVITSPPYCNRYSYVWETRPHLYMMDLIQDRKRSAHLDIEGIGGTWGTATSMLVKGELKPATDVLNNLLTPVLAALRPVDNLMANYVVKYFNTMDEHFDSLGKTLKPGANLAYVIGNSRLKGVDVPTEGILASMLRAKAWAAVDYMLVFRRRIGRRSLYESTIVGHVR